MATVTITGTVRQVSPTQQISDRFSKREIVVTESSSQYPQHIPIEFAQDKTSLLDDYAPGDQVTVTCYVNGREWSRDGVTRFFLSLRGDHIQKAGTAAPQPGASHGATPTAPPPLFANDAPPATEEDDLPF